MDQLKEEMTVSYQQECPKKKGSKTFDRYEKYKVATTVGEALRLGASRKDFEFDMSKGFCKVTDAEGNPVKLPSAKQAPVDKAAKDESNFRFSVFLQKVDGLGLGVQLGICHDNGSTHLQIVNVAPHGLFNAWNQQCANGQPEQAVRKGDRIVSVNDVSGCAMRMVEEIKKMEFSPKQLLNFTLVRVKRIEEAGAASPAMKREANLPESNLAKKQKTSASTSSHERHGRPPLSQVQFLEAASEVATEKACKAMKEFKEAVQRLEKAELVWKKGEREARVKGKGKGIGAASDDAASGKAMNGERGLVYKSPSAGRNNDAFCPELVVPQGIECVLMVPILPPTVFDGIRDGRGRILLVKDQAGSTVLHVRCEESTELRERIALTSAASAGDGCRELAYCERHGLSFHVHSLTRHGHDQPFARLTRDEKSGAYSLVGRSGPLLEYQGNLGDSSLRVKNPEGQVLAHCEKMLAPEGQVLADCFILRVGSLVDAGLILCGLFAVNRMEADTLSTRPSVVARDSNPTSAGRDNRAAKEARMSDKGAAEDEPRDEAKKVPAKNAPEADVRRVVPEKEAMDFIRHMAMKGKGKAAEAFLAVIEKTLPKMKGKTDDEIKEVMRNDVGMALLRIPLECFRTAARDIKMLQEKLQEDELVFAFRDNTYVLCLSERVLEVVRIVRAVKRELKEQTGPLRPHVAAGQWGIPRGHGAAEVERRMMNGRVESLLRPHVAAGLVKAGQWSPHQSEASELVQHVRVRMPNTISKGQRVQFVHAGKRHEVEVPEGAMPGQEIVYAVKALVKNAQPADARREEQEKAAVDFLQDMAMKGKGKGEVDFLQDMAMKGKGKGEAPADARREEQEKVAVDFIQGMFMKGKGKGKGEAPADARREEQEKAAVNFLQDMAMKGKGKGEAPADARREEQEKAAVDLIQDIAMKGKGKGEALADARREEQEKAAVDLIQDMAMKGKGKGEALADARREEQEKVAVDFIQDMVMKGKGKGKGEAAEAFMATIEKNGKGKTDDEREEARRSAAMALGAAMAKVAHTSGA